MTSLFVGILWYMNMKVFVFAMLHWQESFVSLTLGWFAPYRWECDMHLLKSDQREKQQFAPWKHQSAEAVLIERLICYSPADVSWGWAQLCGLREQTPCSVFQEKYANSVNFFKQLGCHEINASRSKSWIFMRVSPNTRRRITSQSPASCVSASRAFIEEAFEVISCFVCLAMVRLSPAEVRQNGGFHFFKRSPHSGGWEVGCSAFSQRTCSVSTSNHGTYEDRKIPQLHVGWM